MEIILIPVDFSKSATNAALYAVKLGIHFGASKIILLNSCYISIYESILPSADFIQLSNEEINQKRESLLRRLLALKARFQPTAGIDMIIECRLSDLPLLSAIQQVVEEQEIDLVVIGSVGENGDEEGVLGRNTIRIAKVCPVPVIVCPPGSVFNPIKKVVLACDFKKVTETIPLNELEKIFTKDSIELLVLNVDPGGHHLEPRVALEETALRQMLRKFDPEYHYIKHTDTIDGIIKFAEMTDAQLIIALPKKHSFLYGLVHSSVSRNLALRANKPVLILK